MHRLIRGASPLVSLGSVVICILGFVVPVQAWAAENVGTDTLLHPLRDAVYGHSLKETELYELQRETLQQIEISLSGTEEKRAKALAYYYMGRWHQAIKTRPDMAAYAEKLRGGYYLELRSRYPERKEAMVEYRKARIEAEAYLEAEESALAHSLYGEILGQMLFLGTVGDAISIGTKARKNIETALQIDPNLVEALIQEASRQAYTPVSLGGDPEAAENMYRSILRLGIEDREHLFNIYGGFGMAAFSEERDEEALGWFEEASALYPGNVFAAGMADFLRESIR